MAVKAAGGPRGGRVGADESSDLQIRKWRPGVSFRRASATGSRAATRALAFDEELCIDTIPKVVEYVPLVTGLLIDCVRCRVWAIGGSTQAIESWVRHPGREPAPRPGP